MVVIDYSIVCYPCNERVEREKPWLFQRGSFVALKHGGGQHNWSHILVSAPSPEVMTMEKDQEKAITVEERIARVEAKLDARLAALEDLLKTLLDK